MPTLLVATAKAVATRSVGNRVTVRESVLKFKGAIMQIIDYRVSLFLLQIEIQVENKFTILVGMVILTQHWP